MNCILAFITYGVLFCAFAVGSVLAQEFQFQHEADSIPVIMNGVPIQSPFAGGFVISKPAFVDIDNDGDLDLFVGGRDGDLHFFRNIGTSTNHLFTLEPEILNAILVGNFTSPSFADIDNDGDYDLFVGNSGGNIQFFRNTGTAQIPDFILESADFLNINFGIQVHPTFADIDADGDLDLFVGEWDGNINFFKNIGTATSPTFILENENFSSIDVGQVSVPDFADIDKDEALDLFVGEIEGNINFYRNSGTPTNPNFTLVTEDIAFNQNRVRSAPTFADIDDDGVFDLFVGQTDGQINYYKNVGTPPDITFTLIMENFVSLDLGSWSTVRLADIDADEDLDLFIGEGSTLNFYRNTGTATNSNFIHETDEFALVRSASPFPCFVDIDKDGDLDLFVGGLGTIRFYRNRGTASEPIFVLETNEYASIDVGFDSALDFADIDNDGDFDLFIGESEGKIYFYRNTGTATQANYILETNNFASIDVEFNSAPFFTDIDNDGDLDLFLGERYGNINFFRNIGTATNSSFSLETESFADIEVGGYSVPFFADIDNDLNIDLFIGEEYGGIHFYRNLVGVTVRKIRLSRQNISFGEVPLGATKTETFTISNTGNADLKIDNIARSSGTNEFSLVSPTNFPIILKPTDPPITVNLNFEPLSIGVKSAIFTITSDAPTGLVNLPVSGNGILPTQPDITLSRTSINFGDVVVGNTKNETFTITNIGNADLRIDNIARTNGSSDFNLVSPTSFPLILTPNGPLITVTLNFAPSSVGEKRATFTITSNDPDGAVALQVSGNGTLPPQPDISLSRSSIDFGDVVFNNQKTETFTISNTGNAFLRIDNIARTSGGSEFNLVSPTSFPIALNPNSPPMTITLNFTPSSTGEKNATFTITSNDPDGPVDVSVSGKGILPPQPSTTLPTMRLYLVGQDKGLSEIPPEGFPGYNQNINNTNSVSEWGPYILRGDMRGNQYNLNIWALSPLVNGVQTTTDFRVEIIINNQVFATFDFSSSQSNISSGQEFSATGIDPTTSLDVGVKVRISYRGGYGGSVAWGLGGAGATYIDIPAAPYNATKLGELFLENSLSAVAVADKVAYLGTSQNFIIADAWNPTSITILGSLPYPAEDIALSGDYAYLVHFKNLRIINVSDPSSPQLVGSYDMLSGNVRGIAISGGYAYVADASEGLKIIDVNNPAAPTLIGKYDTQGFAFEVAVSGDYAYIADSNRGVQIINVSNPANPTLAGSYDTPGSASDIVLSVGHACLADFDGGLQVINIVNPSVPSFAANLKMPSYAEEIAGSGNYIAVGQDRSVVDLIDISDPRNPVLAGRSYGNPSIEDLDFEGKRAFVLEDFSRYLRIYQFQPEGPAPILISSQRKLDFGSVNVGDSRELTFTITNLGDADLIINNITRLSGTSDFNLAAPISFPVIIKSGDPPLSVTIDFSPSSEGEKIDTLNISSNDAENPDMYIVLKGKGKTPLSTPILASPPDGSMGISTNPKLSWNVSSGATSYRLQVSTDATFSTTVVNQNGIIDTSYTVIGLTNNTEYYWRVNAMNAGSTSDWSIVWSFITIIATPTLISPSDGAVNQPTTLTLRWNPIIGAMTYRIQVSTDSMFTTTVVDDSTITSTFRQIGPLANNTSYYWHVKAKNTGGISPYSEIWHFTTGISTGVQANEAIPSEFSLSQNYPNPFNPITTIRYELPKATHVALKVYDIMGDEITVLVNKNKDAGVHHVQFNAANLPSGVYFYRLQAKDFVTTRKCILLK